MRKIITALVCLMAISMPLLAAPELTKAELADELVSIFGLEDESILYFSDNGDIQNTESVAKAVRAGLMGADEDGAFNPDRTVTEEELTDLFSKNGVSDLY